MRINLDIVKRVETIEKKIGGRGNLSYNTGIPYNTLCSILSGRRNPGLGLLVRIADGTGCSLEWLRTGEGEPFPVTAQAEVGDAKSDGPTTELELLRRAGVKLNQKLTVADRLAVASAYLADIDEWNPEHRELLIRCLKSMSDPTKRRRIVEQLLAMEIIDQMHHKKGN
jgi:hypothetical protein